MHIAERDIEERVKSRRQQTLQHEEQMRIYQHKLDLQRAKHASKREQLDRELDERQHARSLSHLSPFSSE